MSKFRVGTSAFKMLLRINPVTQNSTPGYVSLTNVCTNVCRCPIRHRLGSSEKLSSSWEREEGGEGGGKQERKKNANVHQQEMGTLIVVWWLFSR